MSDLFWISHQENNKQKWNLTPKVSKKLHYFEICKQTSTHKVLKTCFYLQCFDYLKKKLSFILFYNLISINILKISLPDSFFNSENRKFLPVIFNYNERMRFNLSFITIIQFKNINDFDWFHSLNKKMLIKFVFCLCWKKWDSLKSFFCLWV